MCATRCVVLCKQADLSLGRTKISTRHVHLTFFLFVEMMTLISKAENNFPSRFLSKIVCLTRENLSLVCKIVKNTPDKTSDIIFNRKLLCEVSVLYMFPFSFLYEVNL